MDERHTSWQHLRAVDGWKRPPRASDDRCQLVVQVMESWFLADPEALQRFFKKGFDIGSLPKKLDIESIPKKT